MLRIPIACCGATAPVDRYFSLPERLHSPVTDGTDVTLFVATPSQSHVVSNYMVQDERFDAVRQRLEKEVAQAIPGANELSPEELLKQVQARLADVEANSGQAEVLRRWLDRARGELGAQADASGNPSGPPSRKPLPEGQPAAAQDKQKP